MACFSVNMCMLHCPKRRWLMKTSVNQTASVRDISKCVSVCAHTCGRMSDCRDSDLKGFLKAAWLRYREVKQQWTTVSQDNMREAKGRTPSTALFLSHLFLNFFGGVAVLYTAPLTRSGCGVGLIHLALCVCLEQTWLLKIVVRETTETSLVCEREWGKRETTKIKAYPIFPQF